MGNVARRGGAKACGKARGWLDVKILSRWSTPGSPATSQRLEEAVALGQHHHAPGRGRRDLDIANNEPAATDQMLGKGNGRSGSSQGGWVGSSVEPSGGCMASRGFGRRSPRP